MDTPVRYVLAPLIRKMTGKEFTYRSCFVPPSRPGEMWFTDGKFDGEEYHTMTLSDEGFIRVYAGHPMSSMPRRIFEISIEEVTDL